MFLIVAGLLVLAFIVNGMFSESRPQEASPVTPERPVGTLTEDWLLTPAEAAGADDVSEYNTSPDGAFTGPALITGENVWAMLTKPGTSTPEQVVGIDPANGEVLWRHDVPGGMCGDEIVAGQLACLARDGGWSGLVVDVATGEAHRWEAVGVDSVMLVHLTAEGLLVVGDLAPVAPHTMVTMLALDGEQRWQVDLADVPGAKVLFTTFLQGDVDGQSDTELMMERPRWRDLEEGKVLLWSTPGAALIDPATGDITASQCRRATAAGDHYFCATDEGIVRRALDGTVEWTLPDLDLVTPPENTPARPLAVAEQDRLVAVDWAAGTEHGALHRFRLSGGGFVAGSIPVASGGDTEHTAVWADDALLALEAEHDAVAWTMNLDDDELPFVSDVFAVDGTLVTDSYPAMGLDPATGEVLWTARAEHGFTFQVVEDRLVSIGMDALAPVQLPGT
ncbi:PQQ-binding-like beta-propeller repeat protein [Ruania albidiflava]|uniref:outer membrane protein assembly factor BamB family protein n=1 Tax=Ruania albidiflava TaxID=366586 RepID=UPI0003B76B68|nr:PQQ-binding-like beta-propeller repeat protein [Ruania albidiflava]